MTARPSGALHPTGGRRSGDRQGDIKSAGRGLGGAGRRQRGLCPALAPANVKKDAHDVYFIFRSMEVGPTFRITVPKYPTKDPNYRILAIQRMALHPLLFLHPQRSTRADRDACGLSLLLQNHIRPQRPQLHRASAQTRQDRLPRQRLCGS